MKQIIADRRALHRIPEIVRDLPRTMAYLRQALSGLRCELYEPIPNSLCAWFDNGADTALAFRSDADALPIQETTGLDFASKIPGVMHACGHDGHMAMLLELARRLNDMYTDRNFLLIFQPAEETTGGAKDICDSGIFEGRNIQAVFGMHLWPDLPAGVIASRTNELMSRSCELTLDITGRPSHIAQAEKGLDALMAAAKFITRAAEIEADWPPEIFRLVRFGRMHSGQARNIISDSTHMEGTLRAFQDEVFFEILDRLKQLAKDLSVETGCEIRLTHNSGYPAIMNPAEVCEKVRASGIEYLELEKPSMITEDFSWYQRTVPGMFFFMGIGPCPALHNSNFNFDESLLETGANFFEKLALRYR